MCFLNTFELLLVLLLHLAIAKITASDPCIQSSTVYLAGSFIFTGVPYKAARRMSRGLIFHHCSLWHWKLTPKSYNLPVGRAAPHEKCIRGLGVGWTRKIHSDTSPTPPPIFTGSKLRTLVSETEQHVKCNIYNFESVDDRSTSCHNLVQYRFTRENYYLICSLPPEKKQTGKIC